MGIIPILLLISFRLPNDPSLDTPPNFFESDKLSITDRRSIYVDANLVLLSNKAESIRNAVNIYIRANTQLATRSLMSCLHRELGIRYINDVKVHDYTKLVRMGGIDEECLQYYDTTISPGDYQELSSGLQYSYSKVPITKINLLLVNVEESLILLRLCRWLGLQWTGPDTIEEYYQYLKYLPPDPRLQYRAAHPVVSKLTLAWLKSKGISNDHAKLFLKLLYDQDIAYDIATKMERDRRNKATSIDYLGEINRLRRQLLFRKDN